MVLLQRLYLSFTVLIFMIFSITVTAQTELDALRLSFPGIVPDARSLGMGNASSTLANNYTALMFNPATLGMVNKMTFTGSIDVNYYKNDATFFGNTINFNSTETSFAQFGMVFPIAVDSNRNVVLSLGYTQRKNFNRTQKFEGFNSGDNSLIQDLTSKNDQLLNDLKLSYSMFDPQTNNYLGETTVINGKLQQSGFLLNDGSLNTWSFGAAYEFAPNVYFGGSVNYTIGSFVKDQDYFEKDTQNNYDASVQTDPSDAATINFRTFHRHEVYDWLYNGWDAKFGVLYKMWNFISLGGSVKLPTNFSIVQKYFVNGFSEFDEQTIESSLPDVEENFNITTPYEFTLGAAVNLWIIRAALEATYIDYTQMKFSGEDNIPARSAANKIIKEKYTGVINVNGGAEFDIPFTGISARAGFIYKPLPVENIDTRFDRKYLTAGVGFESGESLEFDLAYAYGWWDNIVENYGSGVSVVEESIQTHNVFASITIRL